MEKITGKMITFKGVQKQEINMFKGVQDIKSILLKTKLINYNNNKLFTLLVNYLCRGCISVGIYTTHI
jgi:hypothetical protein